MRKLFLAVLACLALQFCAAAGENVEIRFSWWGAGERHETTLAAIKLFESKNPGITVKAEYMGWDGYLARLTTQIGADSEPDLMQINWAWIDMFSHRGDGFYDLNKVKQHIKLSDFSESMINSGMSAGALNGLPLSMTTRFFMWTKATWDRAGVALPKTWADLANAGPKFRALGNDYYATDLEPIEAIYLIHAWLHEHYGEQLIHPTEPKVGASVEHLTAALNYLKTLFDNHSAVPASVRAGTAGTYDRVAEQISEYIEGKWAGGFPWNTMLTLRSKGVNEKGGNMVLGTMLTEDGRNQKPDRIGRPSMMYAVSKNTKNPEAAAKLLSFLLTDAEAAKIQGLNRGMPLAATAYKTLEEGGLILPIDIEAQKQLEGANIVYTSPLFENERVRQFLWNQFEALSYGQITPAEAANIISTEGQQILDRLAAR